MDRGMLPVLALWSFCLFTGHELVHSQEAQDTTPINAPCSSPTTQSKETSRPGLVIADVSFWGSDIQMPLSEQEQIAASIKQLSLGQSLDDGIEIALERVREAWQNHGYFQVHADGEAKTLTSGPVGRRIALSVHVEEGLQYRVGEIRFQHNKVLTNFEALGKLFSIKNGEIAERDKIAKGLDNLKRAYGTQGFINFVSIPAPTFE